METWNSKKLTLISVDVTTKSSPSRKKVPDQKESYERAQSVPYGIEKSSLSSDVENVLAKKFVNQVNK